MDLDAIIAEVKKEFKLFLTKRKELIVKLGTAYEKVVANSESICEEIKNVLGDEIAQKLISTRDIERYCPEKWKKKTKPKNDKMWSGKLVIKNERGDYQSVEEKIAEIDSEIQDKQAEADSSGNADFKRARHQQIKELENKKKDLYKNAKKLIELSHKIIVFLDTPRPELFNALMPLLSHDKYEVEYEFTDTHNGIKTRSNILRGWPAVIFAQAIDYSHYSRWPEIQRRFIITNPKMTPEKYGQAVDLSAWSYTKNLD